ncbi:unnamed protein product [Rotaria magnacalcarata]|uniref:Protein RFT1 homolog n=2 Tax=Rotaria TaxID=231623 RepID=A0A820A6W5_9BILA|nr:unnamed protein product [Rotaria magnacalcarata]
MLSYFIFFRIHQKEERRDERTVKLNASTLFNYLVRLIILISLLLITFIIPYSSTIINLFFGTNLLKNYNLILYVHLYLIKMLLNGINGITETFIQSVMSIQQTTQKILFVLTSHDIFPNGHPTGWCLPEAAHPYCVLENHFTIEWASPKGGHAPLDPSSVENFKDDVECKQFLSDNKAKQGYENTKKLTDINVNDYVALVYVGGHGPCFDLSEDKTSIKLAEEFWKQGKLVSAVCHGPAALG